MSVLSVERIIESLPMEVIGDTANDLFTIMKTMLENMEEINSRLKLLQLRHRSGGSNIVFIIIVKGSFAVSSKKGSFAATATSIWRLQLRSDMALPKDGVI